MDQDQMLDLMFTEALTETEVKAIGKGRGFPAGAVTRSAVKNLFLSDMGVAAALAGLSPREVAALHMLANAEEPQDVTFFERLYHAQNFNFRNAYMLTFNQRYRDVFKEVRERLVRAGLLLMAADPYVGGTRLEQWRFALPDEFVDQLPPLLAPVKFDVPARHEEVNEAAARKKLMELLDEKQDDPLQKSPAHMLRFDGGSIMWGKEIFNQNHLLNWQNGCWLRSVPAKIVSSTQSVHPVEAVILAVAGLTPDDWFTAAMFETVLQVYCFGLEHSGADIVLEEGWKWGMFQRRAVNGQAHYSTRFVKNQNGVYTIPLPSPETYLHPDPDGKRVWLDLPTAPPLAASVLNQIGTPRLVSTRLVAVPDLAKISRYYQFIDQSLVCQWLGKNVKAFGDAFEQVKQRWGKTLLHQNLLVARVTDPGILIQMERAFEPGIDFVMLTKEYVAFRKDLLNEVEKIVRKSEHIVKRVTAK